MSTPRITNDDGKIIVNKYGQVVEATGEETLLYLFGPLAAIAIMPLSPTGDGNWSNQVGHVVARFESSAPQAPQDYRTPYRSDPRRRYLPSLPSVRPSRPAPPPSQVMLERIIETQRFRQIRGDGDSVNIKQECELSSAVAPGKPAYLSGRGSGDITFDAATGRVEKLEVEKTLSRNTGRVTVRLPVKLSVSLRSAAEIAADKKRREESAAKFAEARKQAQAKYEEARKQAAAEAALSPPKKAALYLSRTVVTLTMSPVEARTWWRTARAPGTW
jgi:hypothetical protein